LWTSADRPALTGEAAPGDIGGAAGARGPDRATIRNPIVLVEGFAEVGPAVEWVSQLEAHEPPRVTFVHVINTGLFVRSLGIAGVSAVEFIVDARRDGESVLEMLRTCAPKSVSVTTRLLEAPQSQADQILRVVAEVPCCDAIVICRPAGAALLSSTARMVRRLRSRSSIPVVVLERDARTRPLVGACKPHSNRR
jgi:hypothetical protein